MAETERMKDGGAVITSTANDRVKRAVALRDLALRNLETAELRAVEVNSAGNPALRDFVLAEYAAAGAWYDSIAAASRLAARGEINPHVAERMHYPRGYWDLVSPAAARYSLDSYLVLALIHQESLFDLSNRCQPFRITIWNADASLFANLEVIFC